MTLKLVIVPRGQIRMNSADVAYLLNSVFPSGLYLVRGLPKRGLPGETGKHASVLSEVLGYQKAGEGGSSSLPLWGAGCGVRCSHFLSPRPPPRSWECEFSLGQSLGPDGCHPEFVRKPDRNHKSTEEGAEGFCGQI